MGSRSVVLGSWASALELNIPLPVKKSYKRKIQTPGGKESSSPKEPAILRKRRLLFCYCSRLDCLPQRK
ncbi:hypothetical protein TNIN_289881 [Trichonephila inaurata madagascariensis]|uniref:Uncharacterized protein n=1 Tax=Trichonephila inaurata madagascariensis TaxID=2747483 RepID=A0A8X6X7F6_9ARAC|nr:hypothetical protein TNIN_289881 [Trichonephila inaurata madagascariensis]